MRDEDRHAIGHGNGHGGPAIETEVAVSRLPAEPTGPVAAVIDDGRTVHLNRRCQPRVSAGHQAPERAPPAHDLAHRLLSRGAEAPDGTTGREREDADLGE